MQHIETRTVRRVAWVMTALAIVAIVLFVLAERAAGAPSPATGRVVSNHAVANNQGGRVACAFKDGVFIRRVEVAPGNAIVVYNTEGEELYRDTALAAVPDYAIRTCDAETSTFTGTLVIIFGGFTANSGDSRTVTVSTDYRIDPPVYFSGP